MDPPSKYHILIDLVKAFTTHPPSMGPEFYNDPHWFSWFQDFYAQGKTIMLTLYQNLLEIMPRDNNAFTHVSKTFIFSQTMLRYISSYKYKTWHYHNYTRAHTTSEITSTGILIGKLIRLSDVLILNGLLP